MSQMCLDLDVVYDLLTTDVKKLLNLLSKSLNFGFPQSPLKFYSSLNCVNFTLKLPIRFKTIRPLSRTNSLFYRVRLYVILEGPYTLCLSFTKLNPSTSRIFYSLKRLSIRLRSYVSQNFLFIPQLGFQIPFVSITLVDSFFFTFLVTKTFRQNFTSRSN